MNEYSSESGHKVPDIDVSKATELANLPLGAITASLSNPRKTFNAAKLTELADDIKRRGIDTPITVRPLPGWRVANTERAVRFELVCGERRYRASQMAGLSTIPALVRTLTDEQALEVQLIENLQRDDLTPLEEAEGYDHLCTAAAITKEQVGDKIGKSRAYVYARLKLLDLCNEARHALRDGTVDATRALMVARIPNDSLQVKAMKEIVAGTGYYGGQGKEPMSSRQALDHIQQNYMLKLSDAKFPITSLELVTGAGSCKTCHKRTGNDADLFSDISGADICTDPPCFHKKEEAQAATLVKDAIDKGQTVIAGQEAQELFTQGYNVKIKGYRRLDVAEDSPTGQPLRKIIGSQMKADGITEVMIQHPTKKGELVAALPNDVVLRLLKTVDGQAQTVTKVAKEVREFSDSKKAKADSKAKAGYEQDWRDQLVGRTWSVMKNSADICTAFNTEVHRYVALKTANNLSAEVSAKVASLLAMGKVGAHSAVLDHLQTCANPDEVHMLMIMVRDSSANDFSYGDRVANEGLHLVSGIVLGDSYASTTKDIQVESLAKFFPNLQESLAKTPIAAAVSSKGGKGGPNTSSPNTKNPPTRKAKLSAAEAKSGIAAAMQGIERGATARPGAEPSEPPVGFAIGQKVTVTAASTLRIPLQKYTGKTGTITAKMGDRAWDVTFRGRNGGLASFDVSEIEVVA
jgi:ParB/RepB/Spo0J family partition protein